MPHISISDDNHHVTEAIGSYYDENNVRPQARMHTAAQPHPPQRPLSFMPSPSEVYESRGTKRGGGYFLDSDGVNMAASAAAVGGAPAPASPAPAPVQRTQSYDKAHTQGGSPSSPSETGSLSPRRSLKRSGSGASEGRNGGSGSPGHASSPPPLSRQSSTETASRQFPLNDIDYESSPAAVAQELSNLQAIRRMSMNVDTADPDLPSFGGVVPTLAPTGAGEDDDDDASRLFWVPASLHPELAPKEFKTFVEDRVDKIRRRSGDSDSFSLNGLERSGSGSSSLHRKKSMLSRQIDTSKANEYEDGAERLERKRSKRVQVQGETTVANLAELESLVNDPQQLMRRMSLDTVRRSLDSGIEVPPTEDMPILPPGNQGLKRSTRTTYRRGSLKKGERVPLSKRAQQRHVQGDDEEVESPVQSPVASSASQDDGDAQRKSDEREPILGLTRVQTEPTPPRSSGSEGQGREGGYHSRMSSRRRPTLGGSQSSDDLVGQSEANFAQQRKESLDDGGRRSSFQQGSPAEMYQPEPRLSQQHDREQDEQLTSPPPQHQRESKRPQPKQFHSRLASGPGRTTAQLPGYNNPNPLPHIIETLPDGTRVPVGPLAQADQQKYPERRSSHDLPRPMQRGGAHARPAPGAQRAGSTLDDISSHPSPLPGSGSTRTDALTMVPTFADERKEGKGKEGGRKSSWKWILGSDDDDAKEKEKKGGAEGTVTGSVKSKVGSKLTKSHNAGGGTKEERARLDVLQNSIEGAPNNAHQSSPRGRESLVLNRADLQLDEASTTSTNPSKKEGKRSSESARKEKAPGEKEPGLLQAIFGSKKKTSDTDLAAKDAHNSTKKPHLGKQKKDAANSRRLSPDPPPRILKPDIDYNWTRFSILEERAIYRMAHLKLANPRRALYSQVLLSNFMYSYLAKVQMMHPGVIAGQTQGMQAERVRERERRAQQRGGGGGGGGGGQGQGQGQAEFGEWQRWQEVSL